jgi:hypothetical protein
MTMIAHTTPAALASITPELPVHRVVMEVIGQASAQAIQNQVAEAQWVRVWPHARLGDATVELAMPGVVNVARLRVNLRMLGLEVLAGRIA